MTTRTRIPGPSRWKSSRPRLARRRRSRRKTRRAGEEAELAIGAPLLDSGSLTPCILFRSLALLRHGRGGIVLPEPAASSSLTCDRKCYLQVLFRLALSPRVAELVCQLAFSPPQRRAQHWGSVQGMLSSGLSANCVV